MYLTKKDYFDIEVVSLQCLLNVVRNSGGMKYHNRWEYLKEDGYFGDKTEKAVRSFQSIEGLLQTGVVDSKTYLLLQYAVPSKTTDKKLKIDVHNIVHNKIANAILNFVNTILGECSKGASEQLKHVSNINLNDVTYTRQYWRSFAEEQLQNNTSLKSLQDASKKIYETIDNVSDYLQKNARNNGNAYMYNPSRKNVAARDSIAFSQRMQTKGILSPAEKEAVDAFRQLYDKFIQDVNKYDFAGKIDKILARMRGTNQTGKIKVTGGGILTALSLFPILVDIVELIYCLMTGQPIERIKKILINDIFTFIEGFIIGAVVAAIVAACGLTGGLAIIITVVVCLLIGFIVSIFCPDGSITMTIINGIHKATSRTSYMQVMPAY